MTVVMIHHITRGKHTFNAGLGCITFKARFYDNVAVFHFKLTFENLRVWLMTDGNEYPHHIQVFRHI
ncbi:Uncharacterised protein [Vibrio cholerae]|uniref:Uncharacterized protein n=1 Tax=Vibrio cholerae TaxID=666 RepID=A0A655PFC3_VIBCL|nr:Uncharacterised protein [Vibrio cholerae]